jgi:hypothetical protein
MSCTNFLYYQLFLRKPMLNLSTMYSHSHTGSIWTKIKFALQLLALIPLVPIFINISSVVSETKHTDRWTDMTSPIKWMLCTLCKEHTEICIGIKYQRRRGWYMWWNHVFCIMEGVDEMWTLRESTCNGIHQFDDIYNLDTWFHQFGNLLNISYITFTNWNTHKKKKLERFFILLPVYKLTTTLLLLILLLS